MKKLNATLFVAYFCLTMVIVGGTIFCVMVEYPNWFSNVPSSLETTRNFYKVLHPGYFFQTFAPLTLLTGIAAAAFGWRNARPRNLVLFSLAAMVAAELLTFIYIYPRLNIMLTPEAATNSVEMLRRAAADFTNADRIRTLLTFSGGGFALAAMLRFLRLGSGMK